MNWSSILAGFLFIIFGALGLYLRDYIIVERSVLFYISSAGAAMVIIGGGASILIGLFVSPSPSQQKGGRQ